MRASKEKIRPWPNSDEREGIEEKVRKRNWKIKRKKDKKLAECKIKQGKAFRVFTENWQKLWDIEGDKSDSEIGKRGLPLD